MCGLPSAKVSFYITEYKYTEYGNGVVCWHFSQKATLFFIENVASLGLILANENVMVTIDGVTYFSGTGERMEKTKTKKYEMDMCSGSIVKKMLIFTLPLMASSVLQLLFNAADIVVVGRFGSEHSLAAVGSNGSMVSLLTSLFIGLSVGVNVLVAHSYGANQERELRETIHTAMMISLVSGAALTILGVIASRFLLILMQVPAEVLELSVVYLRIYFLGMTATMVYNFGSAILRAVGDTKRPLYYLMAAGIINVVLNLFFVIVCHLDVAGVALATIISQYISALLVVRCLMKEQGSIRLDLKQLHIYPDKLKRIIKVGLPAGLQSMVFSIANVTVQSSINTFGAITVAGASAAGNIEGFVYVAQNAFYQATISFTGQNMGAGKYKRTTRVLLAGQLCVIVVGLLLGNMMILFGEELLGIYSTSPEVIDAGFIKLRIMAGTYVLCGVMEVMVGAMRGLGYSVLPMVVSMLGACGVRILWIQTVFQLPQFHTIEGLYLSYPVSWIVSTVVHIGCYFLVRHHLKLRLGISFKEDKGDGKG